MAHCTFCSIIKRQLPASIVFENDNALAFMDLRQANPGHVLLVPKRHCLDIRELDDSTGAALMAALTRLTRAVGCAFPNEGISIWNSMGEAAFQEVPHVHFHIHPRRLNDGLLKIYPTNPINTERALLESLASQLRAVME